MPTSEVAVQSNFWENNSILREKRENNNKQNYMPFLFRSKRQFVQNIQNSPPVGSYKIPSAFQSKKSEPQPQFIEHKLQLKNQMCIFKSNQQRFTVNKSHIPGPASYNYYDSKSKTKGTKNNLLSAAKKLQEKMELIKRSPSCPTIPDNNIRFGYSKDPHGNYKLIHKTQDQIEKEKLKLKEYLSTLEGQNQFMKRLQLKQEPYLSKKNKQQQAILNNLEKYVQKNSTAQSRVISADKDRDYLRLNKPKIKLSYGVNIVKKNQDHLGPGCYNVDLNTLKKAKKDQSFQFFSSSEVRFTPIVKLKPENPYEFIFKQKRNLNIKQKSPGKVYKKSFPTNTADHILIQKDELPGPGYYDPEIQVVKKCKGNVKFGNESRFKEVPKQFHLQDLQQDQNEVEQQKENRLKWGNLKKDKIKSPNKQFTPVKQSQIFGIMNEDLSKQNVNSQKLKANINKERQSAVFMDKSARAQICNKTYYQGESQMTVGENTSKLWDKKGSFISKVPKKVFEVKENTPGPGAYQNILTTKKSFNIKNQ